MSDRYFDPYTHNGRWLGRWLEHVGIGLERAGIWIQRPAAWLRWRRLTARRVSEGRAE